MDRIKTILNNSPVVIALVYIAVGALWIQFSDQLVLSIFKDPSTITQIQSLKGWFFVFASGVIIYMFVWENNMLLSDSIEAIKHNKDKFEVTFDQAPVGIAHHHPDETWIKVNQTLCNILGYPKEELLTMGFEDLIHPEDLLIGRELDRELLEKKRTSYKVEKRYRRKDGSYMHGLLRKSAVFDQNKEEIYMVVMLEDITERKNAEEALRKSLNEKNVLLSEIHHRVRNNLALISALFDLQSMYTDDERVSTILHDSQMRVKCLAMVHETYAGTEKTAHIDFGGYLNQLVDYVHNTFIRGNGKIHLEKNISSSDLNINQAVPAGLLCNELLLNVYMNSFQEIENPEINVRLEENDSELSLSISENGIKNREDYSLDPPNSLGMLIIKTLSSQLQGKVDLLEDNGVTTFSLHFQKRELKGSSSAL